MTHTTRAATLNVAAILCILVGTVMAPCALPGFHAITDLLFDLAFLPTGSAQGLAAPETRLAAGIAGGLLAGPACCCGR